MDATSNSFCRSREGARSGAFCYLYLSCAPVKLTEELVWRLGRPLFLLPLCIHARSHFPFGARGHFLFLWHALFYPLFDALIHLVRRVRRMVAPARTHPIRSVVHARVFPCGEAKGRFCFRFPLVEKRGKKDDKHTRHIVVCHRSCRYFDRRIHPGGLRD